MQETDREKLLDSCMAARGCDRFQALSHRTLNADCRKYLPFLFLSNAHSQLKQLENLKVSQGEYPQYCCHLVVLQPSF